MNYVLNCTLFSEFYLFTTKHIFSLILRHSSSYFGFPTLNAFLDEMSLKLYYDLLSQPSRALYIFFKVCGLPFENKLVNLGKMQHHTPEYQLINPFQKVPAIEHNGFKVIESVAILRYVCREFEVADHWYPKDSKAQVKVDEYLEWQHLNTRVHCAMYFQLKYLAPIITGQPAEPAKIKRYETRMEENLDLLENVWLKDKPFLTGSEISIADILGACEVEQVRK
ncbi:glutathione S-transferase theta-1 isoform X3 [Andrena cerasifolii]|uniref:glutathione S-transferase theta-1 isoform X3 n=1 Tax=Andrena cerasifolii TaxID=2819439 RepID=UPI0040381D16